MKNTIYNLFNRAIKWNTFEGVVYQTILTIHQIFLFKFTSKNFYGFNSFLFSYVYLLILILNFGLDKSLANLYSDFSENKKAFKNIFLSQIILQIILLSIFSLLSLFFYNYISTNLSITYNCPIVNKSLWKILLAIIFCESIKKTLKIVGELNFLNKFISITEVILINFYVFSIWFYFYLFENFNLYIIFVPHLIQSIIAIIIFTFLIYNKVYKLLSKEKTNSKKDISIKNIISIRFNNFVNQLSHIIFTGNFLLTLFCARFGLKAISILKITNIIGIYFTVILERAFGLTSSALLSHFKNFSSLLKQNALSNATRKLFITVSVIIVFLILNSKLFFKLNLATSEIDLSILYLFLFCILIDNYFITFEQFLIVESKIYYLIILNFITAVLFYFNYFFFYFSLFKALILFLVLRVAALFFLIKIISKNMNINLKFKFSLISILFFILLFISLIIKLLI